MGIKAQGTFNAVLKVSSSDPNKSFPSAAAVAHWLQVNNLNVSVPWQENAPFIIDIDLAKNLEEPS